MAVDFQTAFEVLVAVEGFSAWKGKSFIGWGELARIDEGPTFDEAGLKSACERIGGSVDVLPALVKIVALCFGYLLRRARFRLCDLARSLAVLAYNLLGFVLRCSPVVSVPLMSATYLLQRGCDGGRFEHGRWLFAFICAKTACYVLCAAINAYVEHRTRINAAKLKLDADGIGKLN